MVYFCFKENLFNSVTLSSSVDVTLYEKSKQQVTSEAMNSLCIQPQTSFKQYNICMLLYSVVYDPQLF